MLNCIFVNYLNYFTEIKMTKAKPPYSTAKGFCQGALSMMASPCRFQLPDDTTLILSFHHLVGFAVELYLKSFLIKQGISEKELMFKPYGHNLNNLLQKAKENSFKCQECDELVSGLKQHETYEYRYLKNETNYRLQPIYFIFELLNALDFYVDTIIGASVDRGLEAKPRGWVIPKSIGHWRIPGQTFSSVCDESLSWSWIESGMMGGIEAVIFKGDYGLLHVRSQ
jgi:hypothetical protein